MAGAGMRTGRPPHHGPAGGEEEATAALARAREAGGPMDCASYACACGYVFAASVSTTVRCPHCGADQAW